MNDGGYKIRSQVAIHFITFAVVVPNSYREDRCFHKKEYRDIVLESIRHCQNEKGLLLHAWYIMSNHLHLVVSAKNHDLSDILRDLRNLPANKLLPLLRLTNTKAERTACLPVATLYT